MKNVSDWGLGNCGLSFNYPRSTLCWGSHFGFGCGWLPHQLLTVIITAWNWTACRIVGHDETLLRLSESGAIPKSEAYCCDCSKRLG